MPVQSAQAGSSAQSQTEASAIPIQDLGATALYKAYLAHDERVRNWHPHAPFGTFAPPSAAQYPDERRQAVAAILEDQNRAWGASDQTFANLKRLRAGAAAVVTGQQVGIFGGPLYSILKAVTAIKLAEEQTRNGIDTIPIFWLATEDHDLAEVSSATILGADHALRKLRLAQPDEGFRVGDVKLSASVTALVAEFTNELGTSEITDLLARCYAPGTTFADAFAKFFTHIFKHHGLILIDNRDPRYHRIAAPVFAQAASNAATLNSALRKRSAELNAVGFHAQVHVDENSSTLFHHQKGKRVAIKLDNGKAKAGKQEWSLDGLAKTIESKPEDFSANALLRPVIEDYLLPTSAYVGGAAEIAYFAQSEVLYRGILGRVTPITPRASTTLIEPAVARILRKYDLQPADAFIAAERLKLDVAQKHLPSDVLDKFARSATELEKQLSALQTTVSQADTTLAGAAENAGKKMRYQLTRLRERASRALLRREADMDRQLQRLSNSLYPHGNLQERELAGAYFLAKHGASLIARLHGSLRTGTSDHQFISV
jgi:bacillithiol synthase